MNHIVRFLQSAGCYWLRLLGGKITEADSRLCHPELPSAGCSVCPHNGFTCSEVVRLATGAMQHTLSTCRQSTNTCISPVGKAPGGRARALDQHRTPAQSPTGVQKTVTSQSTKQEKMYLSWGPTHPVLGIYSLGPLPKFTKMNVLTEGPSGHTQCLKAHKDKTIKIKTHIHPLQTGKQFTACSPRDTGSLHHGTSKMGEYYAAFKTRPMPADRRNV